MERPELRSYAAFNPKIYAYQTPGVAYHAGWTKVGEARTQSVAERIGQQTKTAGLRWRLCWERPARFADGTTFRDHDFHAYLERQGVERERDAETRKKREWFRIDGAGALGHFEAFARRGETAAEGRGQEYFLRNEQAEAVLRARTYFEQGGKAFLWNAKPRFGKTLAAYDLVRQMQCKTVLVLTNRPAVADGWRSDFVRFIGWQTNLLFISENETLRRGHPEVLSRAAYRARLDAQKPDEKPYGFVAFESLQGLKGARLFGGRHDKLGWLAEISFNLLIIDEAHEGVETEKADFAIERIRHAHRLHLSGTPFKQLTGGAFVPEQIFTWSYVDEQEAKARWQGEANNPYEALPSLRMYTYQLSPMVEAEVRRGFDEDHQYAFDLLEFFKTKTNGAFVYEDKVRAFLKSLTENEKYPFSTPALRAELRHTLWVLNRVASVKALERLLKEPGSGFEGYEIVIAAGDGKGANEEDAVIPASALERVRRAIKGDKPTITLSVGQLTVGVTVPEWTGILMLNTCKSPAAYFQATFRVQNPHVCDRGGKLYMKREAYVFDFDPTRTLELFERFANENIDLPPDEGEAPSARRERKIRRLLNFYPVIGEDEEGRMVPLDVAQVLAIPRRLKCQEVVRQGFMSNFLFLNIANLFRNPGVYESILNKLPEADAFQGSKPSQEPVGIGGVSVDEDGNATVPEGTVVGTATENFGDKFYGDDIDVPPPTGVCEPEPTGADAPPAKPKPPKDPDRDCVEQVMEQVRAAILDVATQNLSPAAKRHVARQVEAGLREALDSENRWHKNAVADVEQKYATAMADAPDDAAHTALGQQRQAALDDLEATHVAKREKAVREYVNNLPEEATRLALTAEAEAAKTTVEERIRDRLRGFARTIPSFLMAYGDDALTLANFDAYVEPDVFHELTGITLEEFRLLRDGGEIDGHPVEGHVFDEVVFNDAVREFLKKKRELADYFSDTHTEDIFDYIPQQKTNQVFTPREVVVRMVDLLGRENPGCFDNPDNTFADLYVKSGLYLAEIAKRLYRSETMKERFPEDKARLEHIFTHQLYAMAPTRIIHRIALAYLFGFDDALRQRAAGHFVQADAAPAAQEGRLPAFAEACFGKAEGRGNVLN